MIGHRLCKERIRANVGGLPVSSRNPRSTFVLLASALLAACGGAAESSAPAAKTPATPAEEPRTDAEPRTVEDAQEQIARLRAQLDKPLGASESKPAAAPQKAPAESNKGTSGNYKQDQKEERAADPCSGSCRALASMKRAVDALCRMTGEEDKRCSEARRTLSDSTSRVVSCHCGG